MTTATSPPSTNVCGPVTDAPLLHLLPTPLFKTGGKQLYSIAQRGIEKLNEPKTDW